MAESRRTSQVRQSRVRLAHAVRLLGVLTLLLGYTWAVTADPAQASQAGTAAGSGWKVEPTPNQNRNGTGINELSAISCTSGRACTAVGHYSIAGGRVLALAERWNGTTWRVQAVPKPAKSSWFYGVSCATTRACTAVGYQDNGSAGTRPFAEAWNGTAWHMQTVPLPHGSPGGTLAAVSCTSPRACTATGANFSNTGPTLAVRWNGTRWRVQPTPTPNFSTSHEEPALNAVSCTSATACTATGAYAPDGRPAYFLEAWNGRSWRLVTAPHPAGFRSGALNGVSCVPARCTAVGAWSGGPIFAATLAMAG
jgi:hypothetical protein